MKDKKIIQSYINNFRRHFSKYLKPDIAISSHAYPAVGEGAVLEFLLREGVSLDVYQEAVEGTVNDALRHVTQHFVGGNLAGIRFRGTNISLEPGKLVLIKGEDAPREWSDEAARRDVERIVSRKVREAK